MRKCEIVTAVCVIALLGAVRTQVQADKSTTRPQASTRGARARFRSTESSRQNKKKHLCFAERNRVLTDGVMAYGDKYYDEDARLVRRTDYPTDGRLADGTVSPVSVNNLSCGFAVLVGTLDEVGSLSERITQARSWSVTDDVGGDLRDITWRNEGRVLRLGWNSGKNEVIKRETDGRGCLPHPHYASPLIQLKTGDPIGIRAK